MRRALVAVGLAFSLSGCAAAYKIGAEQLRDDPKFRAEVVRDCVRDIKRDPLAEQRAIAAAVRAPLGRDPEIFCNRLVAAMASGRLTYEDMRGNPQKVLRVVAGR